MVWPLTSWLIQSNLLGNPQVLRSLRPYRTASDVSLGGSRLTAAPGPDDEPRASASAPCRDSAASGRQADSESIVTGRADHDGGPDPEPDLENRAPEPGGRAVAASGLASTDLGRRPMRAGSD